MKTIQLITAMLLLSKIYKKEVQSIEFESGSGDTFNFTLVGQSQVHKNFHSMSELNKRVTEIDAAQAIIDNLQ